MNRRSPMKRVRRSAWVVLAIALAALATACSGSTTTTVPTTEVAEAEVESTLQSVVEQAAADEAIPAMGATVFTRTEVLEQAMAGVRRNGEDVAATVDDKFHLGSDTKAMTAALTARLAERGILGFDVTIAEAFPEFETVDPGFEGVTIRQLLSHTAGINDEAVLGTDIGIDEANDPIPVQRALSAEWLFGRPPQHPAGDQFMYSNVGFVMVGAAMEAATGQAWEELVAAEVFQPLGMSSCGFGAPGQGDNVDQPWGHSESNDPVPPGPMADNHPVLGPAGTVHCTMSDWVEFLQEMMLALDGQSDWLSQESAETIFTPVTADYALGWGIYTEGDLVVFSHDGSNTMWYASVGLVPESDLGFVIVSNASIGPGSLATQLVTRDIRSMYLGDPDELS